VLVINNNYKNTENIFEIKDTVTFMTILKKNGEALTTKIDTSDLEKVKNAGIWFAEWNSNSNSYTVQNISKDKLNKKSKPLKISLQNFVMDAKVNAPIMHLNKDTLDNRKSNLDIAILLKDKYGNVNSKALISASDLHDVVTNEYTWVNHKMNGEPCVIANTPDGRVRLDSIIMDVDDSSINIHHINLNPLDNRRENLEIKNDVE